MSGFDPGITALRLCLPLVPFIQGSGGFRPSRDAREAFQDPAESSLEVEMKLGELNTMNLRKKRMRQYVDASVFSFANLCVN